LLGQWNAAIGRFSCYIAGIYFAKAIASYTFYWCFVVELYLLFGLELLFRGAFTENGSLGANIFGAFLNLWIETETLVLLSLSCAKPTKLNLKLFLLVLLTL